MLNMMPMLLKSFYLYFLLEQFSQGILKQIFECYQKSPPLLIYLKVEQDSLLLP